jgi:MYXO-CTERM domain-containing protein
MSSKPVRLGRIAVTAVLALAALGGAASAQSERPLRIKYDYVPPPGAASVGGPRIGPGTIIFMNRDGGTYLGGWQDDSRSNETSLFSNDRTIPAYPYGESSWQAVMSCMREIWGPFDVVITDQNPGNVPHLESVVTSDPGVAGQPQYVGGVAPFYCSQQVGRNVIENGIAWTFASVWGDNPRDICETAAQEVAHLLGLDHEYLCEDPMTYLWGCGPKSFQNTNAQCGEDGPRTCCEGSSTQNSVQILTELFGGVENQPPTVTLMQPGEGDSVAQGFGMSAEADDDFGILRVEFYIDSGLITSDTSAPYSANAPSGLSEGQHTVEVRAYDTAGQLDSDSATITIQPPCDSDSDCAEIWQVCIDGRCVAGPSADDGLGDTCEDDGDCFSGQCGDDGAGNKYCVEPCGEPGSDSCPGGYDCVSAGGGNGVCWPNGDGGGGGCVIAETSNRTPIAVGLLVLGLLVAFRRRKR